MAEQSTEGQTPQVKETGAGVGLWMIANVDRETLEPIGPWVSMEIRPADLLLTPAEFCTRVVEPAIAHIVSRLHQPETGGIGWAIKQMDHGAKVTRQGWNGKNQWLELQRPDEHHSKMTLPYVFITTVQGDRVPWLCSQTDLLARDWVVVP